MVRWLMFTQSEARREALLEVILCLPQLPETLASLPILLIFGDITMAYRARVGNLSYRPMYGLPLSGFSCIGTAYSVFTYLV